MLEDSETEWTDSKEIKFNSYKDTTISANAFPTNLKRKQPRRPNSIYQGESGGTMKCAVCTDDASGTRYGVFVCEGCKEFFRRQKHSLQHKTMVCVNGDNMCQITVANRTHCRKCRLNRCLALGMKLAT